MRSLLITAVLVLAAGTAAASSIEEVTSGAAVNSSVATVSCAHCPPLKPNKKSSYVVPDLEPGTDRVEIKEIDGEVKSVRTEAWLGGSPVVFVSKASEDDIEAATMKANQPAPAFAKAGPTVETPAAIDETAKTAAVTISQARPVSASMTDTGSREIDPAAFALRLD